MAYQTRFAIGAGNAVRLAEVLQVLVRYGFAGLIRRAGFQDSLPARMMRGLNLAKAQEGEPATFGQRIRDALTELGPTWIKLGQILSTRSDLVGPEIARELSGLQDKVTPVPFEEIVPVFAQSLGKTVEELFESFERTPVASASLSQVYHAHLHSGEEVAVKVQRPGITRIIESDISLMRQIAEWMKEHIEDIRWMDPPGIVDEFDRSIHRELDFDIEGSVLCQFKRKLAGNEKVFIPGVYGQYSSGNVLTMEWVDGVRVDRFDEYPRRNCDPEVIAQLSCELICRMIFELRIYHADPHPANVFITRDNGMAFLDLGMAGNIEAHDASAIADLFLAIFREDSRACVDAVITLCDDAVPENREALEHDLAAFIAFEAESIIGGGRVGKGIDRTIQILRSHHLELGARFTLLLKALATIETVGRSLVPDLDFAAILRPYLEHMIRDGLHPGEMMQHAQRNAAAFFKISRQLPDDLAHLIQQWRRGRLNMHLNINRLENFVTTLDRASNRLAISVITGSIIIGSSLIIATDSPLSSLGIGGYVFAGLLGISLVFSILWSKKF
jgi:ubiquinone biosynthesis protein